MVRINIGACVLEAGRMGEMEMGKSAVAVLLGLGMQCSAGRGPPPRSALL